MSIFVWKPSVMALDFENRHMPKIGSSHDVSVAASTLAGLLVSYAITPPRFLRFVVNRGGACFLSESLTRGLRCAEIARETHHNCAWTDPNAPNMDKSYL